MDAAQAPEIAHWNQAWDAWSMSAPDGLLDALLARYAEPQRAYHTRQHLRECFAQLEPARSLAGSLAEVQLALWFHDAIYDPRAQDNEERSAHWAVDALGAAGVAPPISDRVGADRASRRRSRRSAVPCCGCADLSVPCPPRRMLGPTSRCVPRAV